MREKVRSPADRARARCASKPDSVCEKAKCREPGTNRRHAMVRGAVNKSETTKTICTVISY